LIAVVFTSFDQRVSSFVTSFVKTGVRDSRLEIRKTNGLMMYFTITDYRVSVFLEGVAEDREAGGWPNEQ
jgi:hypothetical protein